MFEFISKLFKKKSTIPPLPQHSKHHYTRLAEFKGNPTQGQVMFVGDSITEAWNQPENGKYLPAPVVNRGIAGDTTWGILDVLPALISEKPRKVFIKLGTNNLGWNTPECSNRIIPDLLNIASTFKLIPSTEVYIQSILPVNPEILEFTMPGVLGGRTKENIEKVNYSISLFQNLGVSFINLYPHFLTSGGLLNPLYTTDGLHLSPLGYKIWAELLTPCLKC